MSTPSLVTATEPQLGAPKFFPDIPKPRPAEAATNPAANADSHTLPDVLSSADSRRYANIFSFQDRGRWRQADREIKKLSDRILMGHVMAERYLHPTRYRSRYRELSRWMGAYADHPQSKRIYALAKKRRPKSARYPRRPAARPFPVYADDSVAASAYRSSRYRGRTKRRAVRRAMWLVKRYSRTQRFTIAQRYLQSKKVKRLLDGVEMDISYARLGAGWFYYGNPKKAYEFAGPAATRSGRHFPEGHWIAGLSAFQLGLYPEAAGHFESMTRSKWLTSWQKSAAAFWAARSNLLGRRPEHVHRWLFAAAKQPHTFYGLLANRLLGRKPDFEWDLPKLTPELIAAMTKRRSGRRALALIQIGRNRLAERELRHMAIARDPKLGPAVLAVADIAGLPALALRAAGHVPDDNGTPHYGALYPVPDWETARRFRGRPRPGVRVHAPGIRLQHPRQEPRRCTRADAADAGNRIVHLAQTVSRATPQPALRSAAQHRAGPEISEVPDGA